MKETDGFPPHYQISSARLPKVDNDLQYDDLYIRLVILLTTFSLNFTGNNLHEILGIGMIF